jgi:cytochrome c oxidase subunit 3
MVLMRLEFGHFKGRRHFSVVAASWYWHFVDIVWVLLFITVYVVG